MGTITDAILRLNERKAAAGITAGGMASFEGRPELRYALLADLGVDERELERIVEATAMQATATVLGGVGIVEALAGMWLDGVVTGITVERIRLERERHRRPYVGEAAEGARRSAQIDREELATCDTNPTTHAAIERRQRLLDSASRWDRQALELDAVGCVRCGHRRDDHDPGCIGRHPATGQPCPCGSFTTDEDLDHG